MTGQGCRDSHVTEGTTVWRYIDFRWFKKIVEDDEFYMPNAYSYEASDINEGRFRSEYVAFLDQAYRQARNVGGAEGKARREALSNVRDDLSAHWA